MAQKFVLEQIEELNHQMAEPRGQAKFFDLTAEITGERTRREAREPHGDEPVTPSHRGEPDQEPSAVSPGWPVAAHEVPVTREDDAELQANVLEPMNTKAGRGTRELNPRKFSPEERAAFDKADEKQLKTWLDKEAIEVVHPNEVPKIPRERILPGRARLVRTMKEQPGQEPQPRSRIVVPGHLDQDLGQFRNDAPTAPQIALHLLFSAAATFRWVLHAFDMEAAFLNGENMERLLYARPPQDLKKQDPRGLWKLKKAVFGLTEAPRRWWLRIRKDLLSLSWEEIPCLTATFILYDSAGRVCGLLVLHVDDGLTAGDGEHYERTIQELRKKAPLNAWRRGKFEFLGRRVKQHDDFSITVDQREYWKKVKPIKLAPARKRQPEAPLTPEEFNELRSLIGKLSWPARESEPRIAFGVSELQQSMTKDKGGDAVTTVEHILMANRIVSKTKIETNQTLLKFKAVDPAQLCVLSFTDASFANMPREGSQAGRFSMVTSADVVVKRVPVNIVGWRSGRISRIVKSTISSEAASYFGGLAGRQRVHASGGGLHVWHVAGVGQGLEEGFGLGEGLHCCGCEELVRSPAQRCNPNGEESHACLVGVS